MEDFTVNFTIRHFNDLSPHELYAFIRLRQEVFVLEQNCLYGDLDGKDLKSWHLFCTHNNEMVGYCRILPPGISYDEASIGRVVSSGKYRGYKIGMQLMERAMVFISEQFPGADTRISAQSYLEKFYEKYGFKRVGPDYLEDDIPHAEMLCPARPVKQ